MNLLARALAEYPLELDQLPFPGERVRLPDLYELPGDSPVRAALPPTELYERLDGPMFGWVQESYLGWLSEDDWGRAQQSATKIIDDAPEWVAFSPGRADEFGVVLPDDAGPRRSVSLFADIEGKTRRLSLTAEGNHAEVAVSFGPHCELSPAGACPGGTCGNCELVWLLLRGGYCCECEC
jgi:hypothetical protein